MPRLSVVGLGQVGVIKDVPPAGLVNPAWTDANNVRFQSGGVESLLSQRTVLTPVDPATAPVGQIEWVKLFPSSASPTWVYATPTQLFGYDLGTGHNLLLGGLTSSAGNRWQGFVFQGVGIFNHRNIIPKSWSPMTTATAPVNLANWPATWLTKSLRPYRNFLIALQLSVAGTLAPFRVTWSDAAAPGAVPLTWTPDASNFAGSNDYAETADYVIDGMTLNDVFIVYKENTTWGLQFVGGNEVMRAWKIHDDVGLLAPDCMASFPGGHFVATRDDIIIHNGTPGSVRSIVADKLRTWLVSSYNTAVDKSFVVSVSSRKEIWFFYPSGSAIYPNRVIMWNWDRDKVSLREVDETPFADAGVIQEVATTDTWASGF